MLMLRGLLGLQRRDRLVNYIFYSVPFKLYVDTDPFALIPQMNKICFSFDLRLTLSFASFELSIP